MPRRTLATFVLLVAGAVSAIATDWPQFLGPDRNGVYTGPPLSRDLGRQRARKSSGASRSGRRSPGRSVVQNRVILFHRVGQRGGRRVARRADRRDHVAVRLSDHVSRRLRLRRRTARGAGGRRRHRLHVRRRRPAARRRSRERARSVWSEDTMKRFNVPKGFFGAAGSPLVEDGRVIANIGGDKARHRRVRRQDRQGALDRDRRRRQLLVRDGGDDWRQALGGLPHPRRPDRARSGDRRGSLPAPLAGAQRQLRQRGDAARGRRSRSSSRREYGPGAGVLRVDGVEAGRRLGVGRGAVESLRDERAITTAISTASTAGRNSGRASAPSTSRPARSAGARISSAPAA